MSYCVEKELYRSRNEATVLSSGNEGYCAVPLQHAEWIRNALYMYIWSCSRCQVDGR